MMSVSVERQLAGELCTNVVTARAALASSSTSTGEAHVIVSCGTPLVMALLALSPSSRTSTK